MWAITGYATRHPIHFLSNPLVRTTPVRYDSSQWIPTSTNSLMWLMKMTWSLAARDVQLFMQKISSTEQFMGLFFQTPGNSSCRNAHKQKILTQAHGTHHSVGMSIPAKIMTRRQSVKRLKNWDFSSMLPPSVCSKCRPASKPDSNSPGSTHSLTTDHLHCSLLKLMKENGSISRISFNGYARPQRILPLPFFASGNCSSSIHLSNHISHIPESHQSTPLTFFPAHELSLDQIKSPWSHAFADLDAGYRSIKNFISHLRLSSAGSPSHHFSIYSMLHAKLDRLPN